MQPPINDLFQPVHPRSAWAFVFAPTNMAFAKYWGKRDAALNLPTHSSISMTLQSLGSWTLLEINVNFKENEFYLNGNLVSAEKRKKIERTYHSLLGTEGPHFKAQSFNNIPTAAGFASSASGIAAFTFALSQLFPSRWSSQELSIAARLGSGSACRSLYGGFVEWQKGSSREGLDSVAHSFASPAHWPLCAFLFITSNEEKKIPSTYGMQHCGKTSPYFKEWIASSETDAMKIKHAIVERNFAELTNLAEHNCLKMHSACFASLPPIFFWNAETLQVIDFTHQLRSQGHSVFFTIDAGPNVMLIAPREGAEKLNPVVKQWCRAHKMTVLQTLTGSGPYLIKKGVA